MSQTLTIATCQYPVSANVKTNLQYTLKQMHIASAGKADIVHFSECNLCGYPGIDFLELKEQNKDQLSEALNQVKHKAQELGIWVIVGSNHFIARKEKPFNSLYIINNQGEVVDRYDKRMLAGANGTLDNKFYIRGKRPVVFNLYGLSCGLLICHEWRYPELYREYKRLGADLIFQSWYDGNLSQKEYQEEGKELGSLILGTARGNAANNYLWISGSNTSKSESSFPAFVVRPDGKIYHKLKRNQSGLLITKIDFSKKYVDPSGHLRQKIDRDYYRK